MARPQVEDGWTKIANELLEAMCRLHLSGNQWQVLHTIIRKTYGWKKKTDWISGGQIAAATGLGRNRVCEALRILHARQVIVRLGRRTGIEKDYEKWLMPTIVPEKRYNEVGECTGNPEESSRKAVQNVPEKRTHKRKKETITKEKGDPTEEETSLVFCTYENNIGILTPHVSEKIKDGLTTYPASWIVDAIGIAVVRNKRSWGYTEGILRRWEVDGKDDGHGPKQQEEAYDYDKWRAKG